MLYRIKKIVHSGTYGEYGTERTDGRYPLRKGRTVNLNPDNILLYNPMLIAYVSEPDGKPLNGKFLYTTPVTSVVKGDDEIIIETKNSIYVFEREVEHGKLL